MVEISIRVTTDGGSTCVVLDKSLQQTAMLLYDLDVSVPEDAMAAKVATAVLKAKDLYKKDACADPVATLVLDFDDQDECVVCIGAPSADEYNLARFLVKSVEMDADHFRQYVDNAGLPGFRRDGDTLACRRCVPDTYAHECEEKELDAYDRYMSVQMGDAE